MVQLDYESPDPRNRAARFARIKNRLVSVALAIGSLVVFAFGLIALQGRTMASTMFGDGFFAIVFAAIPAIIGFPILIGIAFLLRWVAERILKRPLRSRRYWPWLMPAVLGLGCVAGSFLLDRSPRKLLRDFPNMAAPASLSNFQYWWITLPGDSLYILRFDIDPAQFNGLLANHQFVQDSDAMDIREALKNDFPAGLVGSNIQMPRSPVITVYKFSTEGPPGLPHIIDVYTTADRHEVLVCGDN